MSTDQMLPGEIQGWKMQEDVRTFDRQTIFDYINGAGEVYLAYDFREVKVYTCVRSDDHMSLTLELFDMTSTWEAYGIFSHGREDEESGVGNGYEYQGGLLCFWQDRYFVCVQAEQDTPETTGAVMELAGLVSEVLPTGGSRPDIVDFLPETDRVPYSTRYFHNHASLNYHYYLTTENVLHLDRSTEAVLAEYISGPPFLLCVKYPSVEKAGEGYRGFIDGYLPEAAATGAAKFEDYDVEQETWTVIEQHGPHVIVAFDAISEEEGRERLQQITQRLPSTP